jgi:hypothetical protein
VHRRCYWLHKPEPALGDLVLVHYLQQPRAQQSLFAIQGISPSEIPAAGDVVVQIAGGTMSCWWAWDGTVVSDAK